MRKQTTLLKLVLSFIIFFALHTVMAQDVQDAQKALSLVKSNADAIGLSKQNVLDRYTFPEMIKQLLCSSLVLRGIKLKLIARPGKTFN